MRLAPLALLTLALIALSGPLAPRAALGAAGPALSVDVGADRHAISAEIYGMNTSYGLAPAEVTALIRALRLPVQRWGGNDTTRYNWQADITNLGSDYFFQNSPRSNPPPAGLPVGSAADLFVERGRADGAQSIITVPLIGRVADPASPRDHPLRCGFSVEKYGPQQAVDPFDIDCGNGVRPAGALITTNDPADTSVVVGPSFVGDWVRHLVGRYGAANAGGVRFYNLDNEPDITLRRRQAQKPSLGRRGFDA